MGKVAMLPAIRRGVGGREAPSATEPVPEASLNAIISSLPTQPENQLDIGLEILRNAFTQKVQQLEEDNKGTRNDGKEKMALAQVLEQKVSALEKTINDISAQCRDLEQEHESLTTERDALGEQYKRISANVKALSDFKRNCSSFLDHKDDFDVERIHDGLAPKLQAMLADDDEGVDGRSPTVER